MKDRFERNLRKKIGDCMGAMLEVWPGGGSGRSSPAVTQVLHHRYYNAPKETLIYMITVTFLW